MKPQPKAVDTDEPAFHDTVVMEHAGLWERGNGARADEPTVIFPRAPAASASRAEGTVASSEPKVERPETPDESLTERAVR